MCHYSKYHHLAAGPCPAHNNRIHSDAQSQAIFTHSKSSSALSAGDAYVRRGTNLDTSQLENIAEDTISSRLQQSGILVAKPKFDILGTDLLAFLEMRDGIKFCRIQSKGRSFSSPNSNVKIPKSYVSNGFVVFLYLDYGESGQELYMFISTDIEQWNINAKGEYQLLLSANTAKSNLDFFKFDSSKVQILKSIIETAETSGEFRRLIYGSMKATLPSITCEMIGTVSPPNK